MRKRLIAGVFVGLLSAVGVPANPEVLATRTP